MSRKQPRNARFRPSGLWLIAIGLGAIALFVAIGIPRGGADEFVPLVSGAPALRVAPDSLDAGDVPLGQWVQVELEVANVGDDTLRFQQAPYIEVLEGC